MAGSAESVTLTVADARDLVVRALVAQRTSARNAASVAGALVAAEIDGQRGHGLVRVPTYSAQAASGKVDGFAEPTLAEVGPTLVRIDAAHGFAYPALDLAQGALAPIVEQYGMGLAAINRSHHFGQAGAHCERLADRGFAAFVFGNTPGAIAPWGGQRPLYGTNPVAFAAPRAKAPPLVVDLAISIGARGRILAARQAGEEVPEGWALDADGEPTRDPEAALAGSMLPIGGPKGAAIALMIEVMAAAVAGANLGFESSSLFTPDGPPPGLGQTVLAIDVARASAGTFADRLETLIAAIEAEPGVRLPGSKRFSGRERAAREGLAVPASLVAEIEALAAGERLCD